MGSSIQAVIGGPKFATEDVGNCQIIRIVNLALPQFLGEPPRTFV